MMSQHLTILDHRLARMASLALLTVLVAVSTTVETTAYAAGDFDQDAGTKKSLITYISPEEQEIVIGGQPGEPPATSGKAFTQQAAYQCPTTSSRSYSSGIMFQYDLDNPVRAAWNHADKNLALRSYSTTNALQDFVLYGTDDPVRPPQFATIFNPDRVPAFSHVYRVNGWIWAAPPNPGTRGSPLTNYPVTALGLQTIPGEVLQSPTHARNLGSPWGSGGAAVIFADEDSVTLKFTREDSAATGYTVHIDNICTDPNLLNLYNSRDNADRNSIYDPAYGNNRPRDGTADYSLAGLSAGQVFGTARSTEIRVAIVDSGTFMDPRSRDEWWQIRPAVGAATLISPINGQTVTSSPVTYTWTQVVGATDYRLRVKKGTTVVYDQWYSAADICAGGTCAVTLGELGNGTFKWQVLTTKNGNTIWTSLATFVHDCPTCVKPATPVLASPVGGSIENAAPVTYTWAAAAGVTDYQLRIKKGTTVVYQQWYRAADICPGSCTVTPTTLNYQTSSTYKWQVRARNVYGDSAWASALAFKLDCPTCVKAALPVLTSPVGGAPADAPVAYTWSAVAGATDYQLRILKGTTVVHLQWYRAADICGGACSVTPGLVSYIAATYKWQVRAANGYKMSAWTSLAAFKAVPD